MTPQIGDLVKVTEGETVEDVPMNDVDKEDEEEEEEDGAGANGETQGNSVFYFLPHQP